MSSRAAQTARDLPVGDCVTQATIDGRPGVDAFPLRKPVTASAMRTRLLLIDAIDSCVIELATGRSLAVCAGCQ